VRRLKALEPENARLKLVAERDLEIEVTKEIATKNGERAGPPRGPGLCEGRRPVAAAGLHAALCGAPGARLARRKAAPDAAALARMSELARAYPRDGYRRIRVFLCRDGHAMSAGRAYRLWWAAGLQVPRKRPCRRVATGRPRPQAPTAANQSVPGGSIECPLMAHPGGISTSETGRNRSAEVHAERTAAFSRLCCESRHSAIGQLPSVPPRPPWWGQILSSRMCANVAVSKPSGCCAYCRRGESASVIAV
jgi:hypothetical protein